MKSSKWDSYDCWSSAAFTQCPKFLYRQYEVNLWSQLFGGRPKLRGPGGFQANTRLTYMCEGSCARYLSNFQCDQDLTPASVAKCSTRSFQKCKISCHSKRRFVPGGGPTISRHSFLCPHRRWATSRTPWSLAGSPSAPKGIWRETCTDSCGRK